MLCCFVARTVCAVLHHAVVPLAPNHCLVHDECLHEGEMQSLGRAKSSNFAARAFKSKLQLIDPCTSTQSLFRIEKQVLRCEPVGGVDVWV